MVEGETSRIGERSTETISGDTSGEMRNLSNRYSAPIIGGQTIDVEKFDGKINFNMWRSEVMDALIQIDLDVVLKNKRHLYDEEIWDRMNEKACGQIRSCLTKEVKYLVKDEECAVTLWRTLEDKYLLKSPENCLHTMSQVYGFRMKHGASMHDHVSRFKKLLADLKNLDEDIKDEVKAMIMLYSLLEEYSHFLTTLIYGKSAKEKQNKRGGKNSRFKSRNRNIARDECAFCHEKGHWRKDYPKTQKRDGKKPAAANMVQKDEGSDYSLLVMGNDQPCRTMGIGTIRLKMIDGMIRELKEVRFVPALKKNLISVGALEAKCYKVTIEDGIMKFTHGAMMILQGLRCHNLYYLKGGTTDEANFIEAHSDTTKLWHVRLRHVGEKSLQTLMRQGLLKGTKTYKLNFCEHCIVGKKTRVKFGTANHDTREIIEYVHSDNGVAARMNRTLLEKVRCMLSNAGLDKKFWSETVSYVTHLVNRLPSAAIGGKTPMEIWSGKHAQDYDSLRIFGCPAYYHVKDGKLDSRARKAIFMRFKGGVKGFKLWDLEDKKFVCSRDVTFDEASMIKASGSQQVENKTTKVLQRVEFELTLYVPVSSTSKKCSTMEVTPRVEEEVVSSDVPQNEETIDDTWELVKLPKGKRAIGNKWVYTKKQGSLNQTTPRYKARLVAKCFAQKEGIDYNEVFSPVVKHTSICILLALVAKNELELAQLDVKTKFLHGDLEEEIYMIQPCGFKVVGKENHVCSSSLCPTSQEERDYMARVPYVSVVGSLMYAMVCTRLDISQAVSIVSRYMHNPDIDKRRSTTDYVFTLGGGPVSWRSILQSTIGLSSTEAEYMVATEAVKEAIWLRGLLGDFGKIQKNIKVFCDNQSAIFLAKNQTSFDYVEAFPWETGTTAGLIPTFGYVGSRIDAANMDLFEDHVRDEVWRIIINRLRFG
ncbi:retrovirus-related pol polyprotein from transposon TNT 1-94-like protein [Citrus sinensis]|nr:retrovirus-related pol polyprotein from transposon TNT 1-94-like protein [Citrus sinensis]